MACDAAPSMDRGRLLATVSSTGRGAGVDAAISSDAARGRTLALHLPLQLPRLRGFPHRCARLPAAQRQARLLARLRLAALPPSLRVAPAQPVLPAARWSAPAQATAARFALTIPRALPAPLTPAAPPSTRPRARALPDPARSRAPGSLRRRPRAARSSAPTAATLLASSAPRAPGRAHAHRGARARHQRRFRDSAVIRTSRPSGTHRAPARRSCVRECVRSRRCTL